MDNRLKFNAFSLFSLAAAVIVVGAAIFGLYQYNSKTKYKNLLNASYEGRLYSVSGYLDDINKLLSKSEVVEGTKKTEIFAEIWKKSAAAHESLSGLPYSVGTTLQTMKFLAQLSDYSFSMMKLSMNGIKMSKDDNEQLSEMKNYAESLASGMNIMVDGMNVAGIDWDVISAEEMADESEVELNTALLGSIGQVAKSFQNYSTLIYDGPFSDHLLTGNQENLRFLPQISSDEGIDICRNFIGSEKVFEIKFLSENTETPYAPSSYSFEIMLKDAESPSVYVNVSKQGGKVLWMLNSSAIVSDGSFIDIETAIKIAEQFLQQHKQPDMKYRYYEQNENAVVFNFACNEDGITMYPDLIKLKISLSNGEVIGYDARGYINSHRDRNLPENTISLEKASTMISSELKQLSAHKVVIPLDNGSESLCYEFNCISKKTDGNGTANRFLVYINAVSGETENILQLIINEYGVLVE